MHASVHVTFSGPDGCGKSTQVKALQGQLRQLGLRPVHLWSRGGYTAGMELAKRVARRLSGRRLPPSGKSTQRSAAFRRPVVVQAWLACAILDLIRLYGVEIRWLRFRGRPVICDRYLWDTQIDFQLEFPDVAIDRHPLWRLLSRVAAVPDAQFMLTLPTELAHNRSAHKDDPWPLMHEERAARRSLYDALARSGRFQIVDASGPSDQIALVIAQTVLDR